MAREQTTSREESPFRARRTVTTNYGTRTEDAGEVSWPKTRVDLERELSMLRVPEAVVQLALTTASGSTWNPTPHPDRISESRLWEWAMRQSVPVQPLRSAELVQNRS